MAVGKTFAKRCGKRAMSPVVSTVVLTGAMVALVSIALVFANGLLWSKIAESDFTSAKQFMHTVGLTVDDVAWTTGRTETIRYSTKYGDVTLLSSALNYTVYVKTEGSSTYQLFASYKVGVLLFNIPISKYSITNGYHELIFPSKNDNLTLTGTAAPVVRVFAVEELDTGNYLRVVVAPGIRSLSSTINMSSSTYYVKLHLPNLTLGSNYGSAQSVTLTGLGYTSHIIDRVTGINVNVSFPQEALCFNNSFFQFPGIAGYGGSVSEEISIPSLGAEYDDVVLEFFVGGVTVEFGID